MSSSNSPLRIHKRLVQFNSLPFSFGEITEPSYSATFKGNTLSYTNNASGGYFPTMGQYQALDVSSFSATVALSTKDIACEDRIRYFRFVRRELAKSGKLWAVQSGTELIWTHARVTSISENVDRPENTDELILSLTFELIDGYWYMASSTRTFLCEYCPGRFQDFDPNYCWDVNDYAGRCDETGNSICHPCPEALYETVEIEACDWKPLCYYPTTTSVRDALGNTIPSLTELFSTRCPSPVAINYSCELEKEHFCYDVAWGNKYRLDESNSGYNNTTQITFCSKTDVPTTIVRIRLIGYFNNPTITLNDDKVNVKEGNGNIIIENGAITFGLNTQIYSSTNPQDPDSDTYDLTTRFARTNTPMFQVEPGVNHLTITGNLRGKTSNVYIEEIPLTY